MRFDWNDVEVTQVQTVDVLGGVGLVLRLVTWNRLWEFVGEFMETPRKDCRVCCG